MLGSICGWVCCICCYFNLVAIFNRKIYGFWSSDLYTGFLICQSYFKCWLRNLSWPCHFLLFLFGLGSCKEWSSLSCIWGLVCLVILLLRGFKDFCLPDYDVLFVASWDEGEWYVNCMDLDAKNGCKSLEDLF